MRRFISVAFKLCRICFDCDFTSLCFNFCIMKEKHTGQFASCFSVSESSTHCKLRKQVSDFRNFQSGLNLFCAIWTISTFYYMGHFGFTSRLHLASRTAKLVLRCLGPIVCFTNGSHPFCHKTARSESNLRPTGTMGVALLLLSA